MTTEARAPLHELRYPGESEEYRRARDELLEAEVELRRQIEALAAQRRRLPPGGEPPEDYVFSEWDAAASTARPVRLSELFGNKDTLVLYSFMFKPGESGTPLEVACPLCTSIIDGIDGALPHITRRAAFAVVTKAPIERFHAHAHARGWRNPRLVSSAGTTYNRDYGAESSDADQFATATVFTRRDGTIRHFWSSELFWLAPDEGQHPRHVDFMWPVWAVLDTTPEGRGSDWYPELSY
jgi:predicted dithiol-disulfide oxidoreductase (DUF899 family)